jgi:hypothetical protein
MSVYESAYCVATIHLCMWYFLQIRNQLWIFECYYAV